jgi:hypothetical protein
MAEDMYPPKVENKDSEKEPENKQEELVEKIPDDILKKMEELKGKRKALLNRYLNVAFEANVYREAQDKIFERIKNNGEIYQQKVKYAADKLKLKKKKNYNWSFNGKDAFIGKPIPEAPKKEDKKI